MGLSVLGHVVRTTIAIYQVFFKASDGHTGGGMMGRENKLTCRVGIDFSKDDTLPTVAE